MHAVPDPRLPADCDTFVSRLVAGTWFRGWRWDGPSGAFIADGDLGWKPILEQLLARCEAAFRQGDLDLAAAGWERLLPAISTRDAFGGCEHPTDVLAVDLDRAAAGWCRALCELGPPIQRGQRLVKALLLVSPVVEELDLERIRAAHPRLPVDWRELQGPLRRALLQASQGPPAWQSLRARILEQLPRSDAELMMMAAQAERVRDPQLDLALVEAMHLAERHDDALLTVEAACQRAPSPAHRARLQTLGARIHDERGNDQAAHEARLRAFQVWPTWTALVRWAAALPLDEVHEALVAQQELVWDGTIELTEPCAVVLELLVGDWEVLAARLESADPKDWTLFRHPGPLVLPVFLRLGLGVEHLPAEGPLADRWRTLAPPRVRLDLAARIEPRPVLPATLSRLLAARPDWQHDARWFRAHAHKALSARAEHVLSTTDRDAYADVAELAGAWAQCCAAVHEPRPGRELLQGLARRWKRLSAFKRALSEVVVDLPTGVVPDELAS